MLKELIYDQVKVHSRHLHRPDSIKPTLGSIGQKESLETAILLFEGEGQSFLLFILEDCLYGTYKLSDNQVIPLPFSDYLNKMSQAEGTLDLYRVSPVLFKALLALGQMEPKIFISSDLIDMEQLLAHIGQKKEEAFLLLKGRQQANLFYFVEGALCDGYLEETEEMREESDLRDKLLLCAYSSQEKAVSIVLYEEIAISPANDCEAAEKEIAGWTLTEKEFLETPEAGPEPLPEMLDLKENKLHSLGNPPQELKNSRAEISPGEISRPDNLLGKESQNTDDLSKNEHDLWLEVLNGERGGLLIRFASERLSLGRGRVDVRLNDPQISRYHAELRRSQFGLIVTDQHSTNGLFVNEKKVTKKEVELNDIIRLGDTCLKVIHSK